MDEAGMEIEAFFDDLALLHVGERTTLRIVLRNGTVDMTLPGRLAVRASGLTLVSASPYEMRDPSSRTEHELFFTVPLLVRHERMEYAIDVYARAAGEPSGIARLECGTMVREATFAHACRTRAVFGTDAHRFEMFDAEADAGAIVEGRVVVTNTGSASAALDEIRIAGELEDPVADFRPRALAPQERAIVRVRARIPTALADRSVLKLHASFAADGIVHEIGTAQIVARSKAILVGEIEQVATPERGDAPLSWCITIANVGGAPAHARIALSSPGVERIAPGEAITLQCTVDVENVRDDPAPPVGVGRSAAAALDAATIRHIRTLGGLMRHVWALAALCGDDGAFAGIRTALRSVFDRLSIKLRMPHYPVTADDVLDPAAIDALAIRPEVTGTTLGARLAAAGELIAALAGAPEPAPFAAYRTALVATLSAYDDAALIDALVVPHAALDDALEAVLACEQSGVAA